MGSKIKRKFSKYPKPSFIYEEVLKYVYNHFKNDNIFIAPANYFGFQYSEQEVGKIYLNERGVRKVFTCCNFRNFYIDTKGNAIELKKFLKSKKLWPLEKIILITGYTHAKRVRYCFIKEGYDIMSIQEVKYSIPKNEDIISCLWYYKYPLIHKIYEMLNILRYIIYYSIKNSIIFKIND